MHRSINHSFFFPHPPEMVWEYITKPELMELWLMKNNFQPVVGAEFQFRTNPIPSLEFDGVCHCKVLEIVPFKKLSYSWNSGPGEGIITMNSTVTWKLEPSAKGTELFLEHSGFEKEENINIFNGFNLGWVEKLQKIDQLINTPRHDSAHA